MNFSFIDSEDWNISEGLSEEGIRSPQVKVSTTLLINMENNPLKQRSNPIRSKISNLSLKELEERKKFTRLSHSLKNSKYTCLNEKEKISKRRCSRRNNGAKLKGRRRARVIKSKCKAKQSDLGSMVRRQKLLPK